MIAHGEESLYQSSLCGINTVTVNGNNAMSASTIITEATMVHGNVFVARINGTNDEPYDIYCNSTDICQIKCESPNACSTLRLHCDGTCCVKCNELDGISCPFLGVYEICPTPSPTFLPSSDPTAYPTPDPSTASPTEDPTAHPSAQPTSTPSDRPTITPSDIPTHSPTDIPITYCISWYVDLSLSASVRCRCIATACTKIVVP